MKRIKQIIEAVNTLGLEPSSLLRDCVSKFDDMTDGTDVDISEADKVRVRIMRQIMDAVASLAEEMERPAKAEEAKS